MNPEFDSESDKSSRPKAVFLAHNSKDDAIVTEICRQLDSVGLDYWIDKADLQHGGSRAGKLIDAIESSKSIAILIGGEGLGPWEGTQELDAAIELTVHPRGDKAIFLVLLPGFEDQWLNTDKLKPLTRNRDYVDLRNEFEGGRLKISGRNLLEATIRQKTLEQITNKVWRALLVGIGNYDDDRVPDLYGPPNDVEEMAKTLGLLTLPGHAKWNITPLKKANTDDLRVSITSLFSPPDSSDDYVALFYFSGHGKLIGGMPYYFASDTHADKVSKALSAAELLDSINACRAESIIVILDCCQAAPIDPKSSPYNDLGDRLLDVTLIAASKGPAGDAANPSSPSPFTAALTETIRELANVSEVITVDGLLRKFESKGVVHWTNLHPARHAILGSPTTNLSAMVAQQGRTQSVTISASKLDERLLEQIEYLKRLTDLRDALVTLAGNEDEFPTELIRDVMTFVGARLAKFAPQIEEKLRHGPSLRESEVPTLELEFTNGGPEQYNVFRELPWEYVSLPYLIDQSDKSINPSVPVQRLGLGTPTKAGPGTTPQSVALFSSLTPGLSQRDMAAGGPSAQASQHVITKAAVAQLQAAHAKLESMEPVTYQTFASFPPDRADLVVLQAPLRMTDGTVEIGFCQPSSRDHKYVDYRSVCNALVKLQTMAWLIIETAAERNGDQSPAAARRLGVRVSDRLDIPVVVVCHPRAYVSCLQENPDATSFVAGVYRSLCAEETLERAAFKARSEVVSALGVEGGLVGIPLVFRPARGTVPAPKRAGKLFSNVAGTAGSPPTPSGPTVPRVRSVPPATPADSSGSVE